MEIFVSVQLETADSKQAWEDVLDEFEAEINVLEFDVGDSVYSATVTGIGKTLPGLHTSRDVRKAMQR